MDPDQKQRVIVSGRIDCNWLDWSPLGTTMYLPGSVVFLFDLGHPKSQKTMREYADQVKGKAGAAYVITFDAALTVSRDQSGWGDLGGVEHKGPIALSQVRNVVWKKVV